MKNLLDFLLRYNYWFLFLLLEVISFVLLFRFNHYQGSVFFTSANRAVGKVYEISGGMSSYFHLKEANGQLLDRNFALEQELLALQKRLGELRMDTARMAQIGDSALAVYHTVQANVINNSLNRPDNYLTLDKGSLDGVASEMGVINGEGVVGIVYMVSPHYSVALSVLNGKSSINCKIKGSDYFGYLKWEGGDSRYAYVKDLPRHARLAVGDTVVTNGYSSVFPSGIMVGTVDDIADSHDGLSYLLRVRLATDFGKVGEVRLIAHRLYEEQKDLEKKADKQ